MQKILARARKLAARVAVAVTVAHINLRPVRKVAVGLVGSALAWGAHRLGVDLGPASLNEASVAIVGFVVAYLVPARES